MFKSQKCLLFVLTPQMEQRYQHLFFQQHSLINAEVVRNQWFHHVRSVDSQNPLLLIESEAVYRLFVLQY